MSKNLMHLISSSGIPDAEIEQKLSLPRSTIYDWRNGRSKSYKKYAVELSEFFNVSIDYLLGNTDIKKEPTAQIGDKLFGEEAEILKMFRAASPELKAAALAMLEAAERNRLNNNSSSKDK